jgi:nanoRNase/pAp phosphatase (c-di-AMP/oligoRNAs hydrolase)/CBS domain-containing protein
MSKKKGTDGMEIIVTHKNTDFDALASLIAGTLIYPEAIPVLPRNVNPNVKAFISIHKNILNLYTPNEIDLDEVTRMIVVDTNSWPRLDGMAPLKQKKDLEIILWDHHVRGDIEAGETYREEMGANVTLMIRRLKEERKLLTPIQATLLLAGLYEDTGNLTFSSTRAEDAYAAGYLLERHADLTILTSFLQQVYGEKQKDILFEMLTSSSKINIKGYDIAFNHTQINGYTGGVSVVVNMFREIMNVDAAFGIFRDMERDRIIVIGRSHSDHFNIGSIMRGLGGGGHPAAGSALIKAANPQSVEAHIVDLIRGNQQTSVQLSDLISYPVLTVDATMPMEAVREFLEENGCTGVPVVNGDQMVGVISIRDFRKVKKTAHMQSPVKAFMSTDIISIAPDKSPMEAARIMIRHDIGRMPVVEDDKLIGIISRSDVMTYFYDLLPD